MQWQIIREAVKMETIEVSSAFSVINYGVLAIVAFGGRKSTGLFLTGGSVVHLWDWQVSIGLVVGARRPEGSSRLSVKTAC
jgi:hypothetical protein